MKLVTVIGARPQFIKLAALLNAVKEHQDITTVTVHTGQHYDDNMSDIFFRQLSIAEPNYNLDINNRYERATVGRMITALQQVLEKVEPDVVIVFGDTNSTLAGAIAAHDMNIPVAHIEAGLRSYNASMPEEINRVITDRLSSLLFCPTQQAVDNLRKEGYHDDKVILTGDIMLDAMNHYSEKINTPEYTHKLPPFPYILCTLHRHHLFENTGELNNVIAAINQVSKDVHVIMPAHPRTRKAIEELNIPIEFSLREPVGYLEMLSLLSHAILVMTDSGGLQKEAYWSRKVCITVREETEWTELLETGANIVAGTTTDGILRAYDKTKHLAPVFDEPFYGDGSAGRNIIDSIREYLNHNK
jgi:UDP-GlcNAc3NAcA epimerase